MDFNVNVKLDATPALTDAASKLATAISGLTPQVRNSIITSTPIEGVEIIAPNTQKQSNSQKYPDEEITMEMIRALTTQKEGKRAEMKAILNELGVDKIPNLPEDKYKEFYTRIAAL